MSTGIHPDNQVPELADYNVYTSDPVLRRAVQRAGAGWRDAELVRQGAEYGSAAALRMAEDAEHSPPELQTHSPNGERIDFVKFHPAWHEAMAMARRNGITHLPYVDDQPGNWAAYGASLYMHSQIESGSTCPSTMTKASIPVLQRNQALFDALWPKLADATHDARDIPLEGKRSMTLGMGMTEKQGGSDVRTNLTRAEPLGQGAWGEEYAITGHKWFFSAPMCDAHLVLAKTTERGASCFYVPRWRPDGSKNPIHIQRLKDKVGNRSNSSSEVEFHGAWGVLLGEEGRGIPTIIEMATYTRLDNVLSSAGFLRRAYALALHHARHRWAFGKALVEQPAMAELLGDIALESQAATLLAMDLAARFGSQQPLDLAWRRLVTPAAKFWNCKRAVHVAAEAMEVHGGNGYVETGAIGRLFREAPVNSIWEGSGNVMCLDVLRAVSRNPDDAHQVLDHLETIVADEAPVRAAVQQLRQSLQRPPAELEREARRITQRLALCVQAALMLQHASAAAAGAFIASRFDADWGPVVGVSAGTADVAALLDENWL
ncbi:DNA alkylation response protein [Corticibacter populi]|uniref:DNA alkylation response protein n=1 Tax=Corticibacter populi TaxID=1550736 RepID=A0A3M6QRU9_9BURK|nr:acyl-CoA dehydrogenase family protein [Corticibacter populi]RMX05757.1 DNA alkylation response protein [Corticibacter populi]RZS30942.1 putative acyl-CoA dehydrogenase [Corticibacter populi]